MKHSKRQISKFMRLGKSPEKFFLNWEMRRSFCDPGVQEVLLKLHPSAFAIAAWSRADHIALHPDKRNWMEFYPFMAEAPVWAAELLAAVSRYYKSESERMKNPDATLDHINRWRRDRYLYETASIAFSHQEAVRLNTLKKKFGHGIPAMETPKPARSYMDGNRKLPDRNLTPGAFRQEVTRENKRRDKIMLHWAESWLTYLSSPSVTKTTPNK